jgi:class 3 adenylate cyclase/tetratricopeptide (TPR) repeat protein
MDNLSLQNKVAAQQRLIDELARYVPPVILDSVTHDQKQLQGERRQVAVLFADIVNFTYLSESLDAEVVFNLLNSLLVRLADCVHRYGGLVDKFTGDGLMAVFGAPLAHENNEELAIRAALDMQQVVADFSPAAKVQMGAPLTMRIGIHSGKAVAGIIGTEEQIAYTVIGQTVNLASKLESETEPGHILVSEHVYQKTRALFTFRSSKTIEIKGLEEPLATHEVLEESAIAAPERGVMGVPEFFLGRETELSQLWQLFEAFRYGGEGRLVLIEGEAGVGKSRLVGEWLRILPRVHYAVWRGHGLPYAQGARYSIYRSLLRDVSARGGQERPWEAHISPSLLPFIEQILGEPLDLESQRRLDALEPERVKQLTAVALREWIVATAEEAPLIIILEDFHWAGEASRDILQSLLTLIYEVPVLFCLLQRPEPEGKFEADEQYRPFALDLQLTPLSYEESRELLGHLVDLEGIAESTVDTILTRAEGNPFYIEEFVRMLIEKNLLHLEGNRWRVGDTVTLDVEDIPTSLRSLIMARVDRLPPDLGHLLRDASVIGLQFDARLLEKIERTLHGATGARLKLERLRESGMLVQRPGAGEQVYAFPNVLIQETIYRSILRTERPDYHHVVAQAIEAFHSSDLYNQAEVLAQHYYLARERQKALHYALVAGERAKQRFANQEALEYYSRALQLAQHFSERNAERFEANVGLGEVQSHVGEYEDAVDSFEAALEEWPLAPPEERVRVMIKMAQVWDKRGDLKKVETWLQRALGEIESVSSDQPLLLAQIKSELGWYALRQGDLAQAERWLNQGLHLVEDTKHYGVLASILNRLGAVYYHRSYWERATEQVQQALDIRKELGDLVGYAGSLNNLGILHHMNASWEKALDRYEEAAVLYERIGATEGVAVTRTNLGSLYTDRGQWDKALENLNESIAIAERTGHPYELAQAHMNLGRLALFRKQWKLAKQHLDCATDFYEAVGAHAHLNLADTLILQSWYYLEQGKIKTAADWVQRAVEILSHVTEVQDEAAAEWGRCQYTRGRMAYATNNYDQARQFFEQSAALFQKSTTPLDEARNAYWYAQLLYDLGEIDIAEEQLERSEKQLAQLGAESELERLEALRNKLRKNSNT